MIVKIKDKLLSAIAALNNAKIPTKEFKDRKYHKKPSIIRHHEEVERNRRWYLQKILGHKKLTPNKTTKKTSV